MGGAPSGGPQREPDERPSGQTERESSENVRRERDFKRENAE